MPRLFALLVLTLLGSMLVVPTGSAAVIGDDYPANLKAYARDAKVDPWHFYNRECTSFVAWRINHALNFPFDDYWLVHWGNASNWKKAATSDAVRKAGVTVDGTASVGSVAWWGAGSAGSSTGHVAWVAVASSSSITVEEYNYARAGYYGTRVISRDSAKWPGAFIHFKPVKLASTAPPVISGTPQVGVALTASTGTWSIDGLSYAYQWSADGKVLAGATGSSYTPGPDDVDKTLTVRVTATKTGQTRVGATSAPTAAVTKGDFGLTTAPAVVGAPRVGAAVSASPGKWTPAGTYHYQWRVDSAKIAGATDPAYTPAAGDLGKQLSVTVTVTSPGYRYRAKSSSATTIAPGVFAASTPPSIAGAPQVGQPLRLDSGTWTPAPATVAIQWYVAGAAVRGATTPTFTPRPADLGRAVTARVTLQRTAYTTRAQTIAGQAAVIAGVNNAIRPPAITGTAMRGSVLTVTPGSWQVAATRSYQWYADGVAVRGATGRTFQLTSDQVGKQITVTEVATAPGYQRAESLSAPTARVLYGAIAFARRSTVTGSPRLGAVLTVHPAATTPAQTTLAYQWFRGSQAIPGATAASYRTVVADLGSTLTVRVVATRSQWATATQKVSATAPVRSAPTLKIASTLGGARGRLLKMTVQVSAPSVPKPGGVVAVYDGQRRIARVEVVGTLARIRVVGMQTGVRHLRIAYLGTSQVMPVTVDRTIRVR